MDGRSSQTIAFASLPYPKAVILNRGYTYPLGYVAPKQGVRSVTIFRNTRPEHLKKVMSIVVSAVNFLRSQALNHRLFRVFWNDFWAQHNVLLYHIKVR